MKNTLLKILGLFALTGLISTVQVQAQVTVPVRRATAASTDRAVPVQSGTSGQLVVDSPVTISGAGAVAGVATLDTGQGANELYDMDQNVLTTSDVTFNGVTVADLAYNATTWNGSLVVPTRNAVRDQMEALASTYQPLNAGLTSLATLTLDTGAMTLLEESMGANKVPAWDGVGWVQLGYTASGALALAATGDTGTDNLVFSTAPTIAAAELTGATTAEAIDVAGVVEAQSVRENWTPLASGTVLTNNTNYYDTFSANRTLTFSAPSPANGDRIDLLAICSADVTLTVPSSQPYTAESADTSVYLPPGLHRLSFVYINSAWRRGDTSGGKNNIAASDPAVTDDLDAGYAAGSLWFNTTSGALLWCEDNSDGAAVWNSISSTLSDTAYDATSWNGVTTVAPSKNAVRDQFEALAQANVSGLTTADSPQFAGVNVGAATDTTITRVSAGVIAVEGATIYAQGGALGTPASGTLTNATGLPQAGTVGLTTADSPQFAGVNVGAATDTTITRTGAGAIAVEGVGVALNSTSLAHTASTIELGAASDTTLSRVSAGVIAVEGATIYAQGGALGTPASGTLTNATGLPISGLAAGTLAVTLQQGENTPMQLDPAGSADGKYSGTTVTGTGGATIAFGDIVTLDKDDSRWELVDISVAAAATGDARGIVGVAVTSSTDGGAITVLLSGIVRADANFPALTIGAAVYASTTGDIVVTQPSTTDHVIRIIGFALTADEIYFCPSSSWITHT